LSATLVWEGGSGFGVKFGLLSTTISWLTGNVAVVYWLVRSYTPTSGFGNMRSSSTQTFLTNSRHGNLNFRRVIYFRFRSGLCFRSDFYVRGSGGSTVSPRVWPGDHGRGRFYACHYGCRVSFPGRPLRSRLAWQVTATYVTWRCGFHSVHEDTLLTRLRIDANNCQNPRLLSPRKLYVRNVGKSTKIWTTPSPNQSGNRK